MIAGSSERAEATLGSAVARVAEQLRAAGVEPARREARLLVALAAGISPETVIGWPERILSGDAVARLRAFVERRCAGEPYARISGIREFWSLPFRLGPQTLDPRADTESLIEAALARVPDRDVPIRILDLGTGTGCILLALLHELRCAFGVGVDLSSDAVGVASANARSLGVSRRASFVVSDWCAALDGRFDLVLSNPPYIPDGDIVSLDSGVRDFDPHRALAGGADGLDAYRRIATELSRLMASDAVAILEVGEGQVPDVSALLAENGLRVEAVTRDLGGIERCIVARKA